MPTSRESVADLYSKIADSENVRLATHPMEREITLRVIRHALTASSKASSSTDAAAKRIADVGGGPGKLAFVLADEGHHVDLIDLSPGLIQLAQAEQDRRRSIPPSRSNDDIPNALLASISVGDALDRDLPLEADSYDAVLLLGPLYHLLEEGERIAAVRNALRLAKPGHGFVFLAFVSIEAHLRDLAMREPQRLIEQAEFYSAYLASGRYARVDGRRGTTSQSFHTSSSHVREFCKQHFAGDAELVSLRSTEGILGGGLDARLVDAGPGVLTAWVDLMLDGFSDDERHLGCADHLLAVLRRRK